MNLSSKVVLIAGASGAIGDAIAMAFAREQAKIVLHYNKDYEKADRTRQAIVDMGGQAALVHADISDHDEVEILCDEAIKAFGQVDILINNASISTETGFLKDDYSVFKQHIDINLLGTIDVSQIFMEYFIFNKIQGQIINTSSTLSAFHAGDAYTIIYNATKAAVNSLTATLSKYGAEYGIRVNGVAPGAVKSEIWEGTSEEESQEFIDKSYIKRWIEPEEIAEAFVFLARNEAIAGQTIFVDGGYSLK